MVSKTDFVRLQQMRVRVRNDFKWIDSEGISFLHVPELDEVGEALQEAEDALGRAIASLRDE